MPTEITEQFGKLWESSNSPPDLFAFLEQDSAASLQDKLTVVLSGQRSR
jgi:hypothetical protein